MKNNVKRIFLNLFQRSGYRIIKKDFYILDNYHPLMEVLLTAKGEINFVQVGANDGKYNDPIYSFLMSHKKSTRALLIEPQEELLNYLSEAYSNHPNITIWNGAIASSEKLSLFRIKPKFWDKFKVPYFKNVPPYRAASGLTSSNKEHIIQSCKLFLPKNIYLEEAIEEVQVPGEKLLPLLKKLNFNYNIDVLQVDTEGADDEVIYNCDITAIKPVLISFEHQHLDIERKENLIKFLKDNKYITYQLTSKDSLSVLRQNT